MMTAENVGIDRIGQIAVAVQDVDRAADFYQRVLGLPLLFKFPGLAFFDCGGVRLMLSKAERPEFDRTSIIYYRVPDVTAAALELERRGVVFEGTPHVVHRDERHELWMAFFRDSEGNYLGLMREQPL
jgi:catechol 2,3-dioxygenase-like lactoylglutathione lyase family enzyme